MVSLLMKHETDAKQELLKNIGDVSHIQILHNYVLVATYIRPNRTAGGIWTPASVQDEDKWQGKVGLVISKGPLAFKDDDRNQFHGQDVPLHSWISYRQSDGWQLSVRGAAKSENADGGWHCRMLQDIDIKAVLSSPDDLI